MHQLHVLAARIGVSSKELNVNVNVIVVLNANVLRLDEDRRQRRSGISIWT